MNDPAMLTHAWLDVRHADHNIPAFASRILTLLNTHHAVVVDLSRHEDHGNRIPLRTNTPRQDPSHD